MSQESKSLLRKIQAFLPHEHTSKTIGLVHWGNTSLQNTCSWKYLVRHWKLCMQFLLTLWGHLPLQLSMPGPVVLQRVCLWKGPSSCCHRAEVKECCHVWPRAWIRAGMQPTDTPKGRRRFLLDIPSWSSRIYHVLRVLTGTGGGLPS